MNWSSDWSTPKPVKQLADDEAKEASEWVKPDDRSEAQKVHDDAAIYGIGFIKGGKHFPLENVFVGIVSNVYDELKARRYKTTQIKLGNKTISVIVVGDLGLDFCEPEEKDTGWNIYHLPTLACFSSAVPANLTTKLSGEEFIKFLDKGDYEYDKPNLLNWMARVQENYPTSWQVLRLLTPDTYKDNGETAKDIIQKWCLSVKVE